MDTNIISYVLKNDEDVIRSYRQELSQGNEFVMLPIVYYEISRWLLEKGAKKLQLEFNEMCMEIPLLKTNKEVWDKAASLYVQTRRIGKPVGSDADLLIAAFCLINGCVLVTNNVRHFEYIEGINIVNWKASMS
jgi:tRNA(fMet)-specific endonuclease VapC